MFQEKIFKKPPKIEVVGIFPPNSKKNIKNKNKKKRKGQERKRKVTYLLFTLYLI